MRAASQGGYGQCLALNMPDLNKNVPARGQVLSLPGYMRPAACLQVSLAMAPGIKRSLRNAEEIKFHTGTFEENGKIYLLESQELSAGENALATVVLNNPVAAAPHDRFILRRPSPPETLAGGEILLLSSGPDRPKKAQILPVLQAHRAFFAGVNPHDETGVDKRVEWLLLREMKTGANLDEISKGALLDPSAVQRALNRLVPAGVAIPLAEGFYIHSQAYKEHRKQIEDRIREASGRELSVSIGELKNDSNWPAPLWQRIETELEKESQIRRRGDRIILSAALEKMPPQDKLLMESILKIYRETGFQSPRPDELPEKLRAPADRINRLLALLCNEQQLFKLTPQVMLSREHLGKAQSIVIDLIRKNGLLDSSDFKIHIDSSRKYALAILDYFDARRITVRNGNERKLASGHETRLLQADLNG
jgi:selenocysteine-specific elongation factor